MCIRDRVNDARPSYTVPTLERLRTTDEFGPQRPLVLLVGADAFSGMAGWHRWESLFDLAHIAVAHRPGFPVNAASLPTQVAAAYQQRLSSSPAALQDAPAGRIVTFAMTQLAVSATQIRTLLLNGRSPRYLLPEAVIAYIPVSYTHLDVYKRQVIQSRLIYSQLESNFMRRTHAFIALLALVAVPALAQAPAAEPPPVPDVRPPAMVPLDDSIEPQVTIRKREGSTVEEYRINGRLYKIIVTPEHGVPYTLVDQQGDGSFACLLYTSRCV